MAERLRDTSAEPMKPAPPIMKTIFIDTRYWVMDWEAYAGCGVLARP